MGSSVMKCIVIFLVCTCLFMIRMFAASADESHIHVDLDDLQGIKQQRGIPDDAIQTIIDADESPASLYAKAEQALAEVTRVRGKTARGRSWEAVFHTAVHYLNAVIERTGNKEAAPEEQFLNFKASQLLAQNYATLLRDFTKAISILEESRWNHVEHNFQLLAYMYLQAGGIDNLRKCEALCEQLMVLDSVTSESAGAALLDVQIFYAHALARLDKFSEAIAVFETVLVSRDRIAPPLKRDVYYELGRCYVRLNRRTDAELVWRDGVEEGLFISTRQRGRLPHKELDSQPVWPVQDLKKGYPAYTSFLEAVSTIDSAALRGLAERLPDNAWIRQDGAQVVRLVEKLDLVARSGMKGLCLQDEFQSNVACRMMFHQSASRVVNLLEGEVTLWRLPAGRRLHESCGDNNGVLRLERGIVVPSDATLRIVDDVYAWGDMMVWDDSFEHEVRNDSPDEALVVLRVDLFHPEHRDRPGNLTPPKSRPSDGGERPKVDREYMRSRRKPRGTKPDNRGGRGEHHRLPRHHEL